MGFQPSAVDDKMSFSGQDEGDFTEIVAVRRFRRAAAGELAGKEKSGIQILIGNVILYFAHGMCYLALCI